MATEISALRILDPAEEDKWPPLGKVSPKPQDDVETDASDEWEDIEHIDVFLTPEDSEITSGKFLLEEQEEEPPTKTLLQQSRNPKILHHSSSSPCLNENRMLEEVSEESENPQDDENGSFSMVLSVASVRSHGTWATVATSTTVSWKDKVAHLANDDDHGTLPTVHASKASTSTTPATHSTQKPRKKTGTRRLVVVPHHHQSMKRCAYSTGDLPSLAEDDDDILGACDAMEFYHRKALGASNRSSGLRMRPDEAKRKQFTLAKKAMQRSGQ